MAYKVKYRLDYCNKEKLNARLDFEIKDYTSTTIYDIVGTQDAFSYKVRNEKPDRSGYFRTLEADINIFEDENFNIDNLLTSDETKIRVKFYIEGQIEFVGFIIPDFFEVSIDKPRVISMVASDRIGTLKNQTLPRQTGVQSFRYMLEQSLLKTGLDLPLNSTINFNPIGETGDFLTNTGGLMERLSSDKGASISCYDVIKSILIVSNSILLQEKGQWHILNKLEYESRPITKDIEQINVGGRRMINPPSSKVGVMAEFGGGKIHPKDHNFRDWKTTGGLTYWTSQNGFIAQENTKIITGYDKVTGWQFGSDALFNNLENNNQYDITAPDLGKKLKSEEVNVISKDQNKIEITVDVNVTSSFSIQQRFRLVAEKGVKKLSLNKDGVFEDYSEAIGRRENQLLGGSVSLNNTNQNGVYTTNFSYSGTLEDETNVRDWKVYIILFGGYTVGGLSTYKTFINSASFTFVSKDKEQPKGNLYKIEQGVNFTKEDEIDTTIFGDFITSGINGYFYDYPIDDSSSIYWNNEVGKTWRSLSNANPDTLLLHSVRQRAIMFSSPHNIITAVVSGKFSALDIYNVCGIKYVLVEAEYDFYRNETELRIEEIKYDNSVLKTDFVYSYFGGEDTTSISGVSGVSSGGSSGGGGAPCLIKIDEEGNYYVEENFYSLKDVSAFGKNNLGGGGDGVALTSWVDQITTLSDFNQNTKFIKQSEVVDNLTSNLSNLPLSARQGMILKNFIDNIEVGEGGQVVVDWDSILAKPTEFTPSAHTHVISDVTGLQIALDAKTSKTYVDDGLATKENTFAKNTAFNKNFGTTAGTVSQGNHTHTFASLTSKPTTLSGYGITDGAKSVDVDAHITDKDNPHGVTKTQVGLSNVLNVKQATKVEFDTFKNFFDSLFELDGEFIKAKKSLYSTGDLSAFGKDNLGGGGTGGTDLVSWVDQIMTLTDFNVGSNFINIQQVEAKGYATVTQLNDRVKTPVPLNAKFTDTIVDISGKVDKVAGKSLISDSEISRLSNVTNQDLTPYATNSRVNAIDNRLVTVESNYTTQSDIDTAIDGIEIGGRNLALNTSAEWKPLSWASWYCGGNFIKYTEAKPNEIYTISIHLRNVEDSLDLGGAVRLWVWWLNEEGAQDGFSFNGSLVYDEGISKATFTIPEGKYGFEASIRGTQRDSTKSCEYRMFKAEKGTKPTDWTPAPEDQVSDWFSTDEDSFDFIKNKPTKLSQFSNVETDFVNKNYVTTELNKKVDKVTGKSLISDSEISRLSTVVNQTATSIGLGNVTNESKAVMFASPTFTGTVSGVTKAMVGLSNVDNIKQATKVEFDTFVSAFNAMFEMDGDFIKAKHSLYSIGDLSAFGKDNIGGGTGSGASSLGQLDDVLLSTVSDNQILRYSSSDGFWKNTNLDLSAYATISGLNNKVDKVAGYSLVSDTEITRLSSVTNQTKVSLGLDKVTNDKQASKSEFDNFVALRNNPHQVTKAQVGLGNVTNVLQASKSEFDARVLVVNNHINDKTNPHAVTKSQVGLSRVENKSTADMFSYANLTEETSIEQAYIDYAYIPSLDIPNGAQIGSWSFKQVGTELHFLLNNEVKIRMLSDGTILATGDVTAFG